MSKHFFLFLLFLALSACRSESNHPQIYVTDSQRSEVRAKIRHQNWAKESLERIKQSVDPYVLRHEQDPEWIVSRLAMYWKPGERYTQCYLKKQNWDYGEGDAPVPTVRMPGMRTWNKYINVPLAERTPYNETGDMWGLDKSNPSAPKVLVPYKQSGHMIRGNNVEILTLAENASFLYWLTGQESYAKFASDIFYAWLLGTYYMNPILDPEQSCGSAGGHEPGGICGYYDYEQIHDDLAMHAAIVYDFCYDYLLSHPHSHLSEIEGDLPQVAGIVFKRFIDLGMVRGDRRGNWNVNGWSVILRPILALESDDFYPDGHGREYYLHYLAEESTPYHEAIPDILKVYDPITGLWPESPGYAFSVINMLMDFANLLGKAGIDVISANPSLQKAALAVLPWMDSRGNLVNFGDARGGAANYKALENLLAYYMAKGEHELCSQIASAISSGLGNGSYSRSNADWSDICCFVAEIPDVSGTPSDRVSYSRFHRVITMKGAGDLMAVLYGGRRGSHLSSNGLAVQLYGSGYALAPDAAGYESYWSKDMAYHQSATGSNTIIPGYSAGEITLNLLEPSVGEDEFASSKTSNPYINVADVSAGEKRRVLALVGDSDGGGYYVDIFRSDLPDNDYIFHNVGQALSVYDAQSSAPLGSKALSSLESLVREYDVAYSFFCKPQKSVSESDFYAEWCVSAADSLWSRLYMSGAKGREIYCVEAPYTTINSGLTPSDVSKAPDCTPTLIVRQKANNAWASPFVSVYQSFAKGSCSIESVRTLEATKDKVAVRVLMKNGRRDYIFCGTSAQDFECDGICFSGRFGVVSVDLDGNNTLLLEL